MRWAGQKFSFLQRTKGRRRLYAPHSRPRKVLQDFSHLQHQAPEEVGLGSLKGGVPGLPKRNRFGSGAPSGLCATPTTFTWVSSH